MIAEAAGRCWTDQSNLLERTYLMREQIMGEGVLAVMLIEHATMTL